MRPMLSASVSLRNLRFAVIAISLASCSQDTAGPAGSGSGEPPSPINASNARTPSTSFVRAASTRMGAAASMSISVAQSNVAYISLQPQTYPGGTTATITNQRSAASVTTPMVDGGIDPVPVIANAGDGISLAIQTTEGSVIATVNTSVPSRRPPKIVRTIPGRGKTGIPLNKNIVVVFTEPVAENSLAASVKLFRGNAAVSGTAAILEGTTAAIVFKPAANLQANANYELVVTNGVRDLDGDPADSVVRVSFTTGASIEGPAASASIIPDGADLTVGEQFQAVVVAKDAAGNILTGYPVKWSADSSAVEVTTSGLVTARHTGVGTVFAGVNDQVGAVIGVRVFDTLPAVTSVIVAFDSALVSSGTLLVGAIAIDADGNLLERRLLEWSSSNSGVATVAATSNDQIGNVNIDRIWFHGYVVPQSAVYWAKVSGIANGVARIVATAEGHSGTTVITVAPSSPVVGFVLSADTSTLLLHQAAPVSGYSVNAAGGRTSLPPAQIQWESSDPSVATVDAEGIITALATGSATAHRRGRGDIRGDERGRDAYLCACGRRGDLLLGSERVRAVGKTWIEHLLSIQAFLLDSGPRCEGIFLRCHHCERRALLRLDSRRHCILLGL